MLKSDSLVSLTREYTARNPRSGERYAQFCRYLPGGETRSVAHYDPYPVVLVEGDGAVVRDLDGNEYLDVLNNYTALVHGHAFAPVVEAVEAVLPQGTVFPAPHLAQLELAHYLVNRYPAVEMVRFTNSGTEAALLALRIARKATARRKVVIFDGAYHGSIPEFVDNGADTVRLPYNEFGSARATSAIDDSIAAVFVEPFLGSGGVIPGQPDFLRWLQNRANQVGGLVVLDEVQGLRNAPHGMHASLDLQPDLLLMGKIIGGGFPVGAVGGRKSLLEITRAGRAEGISHSGTFNGNVITMTAGIESLKALDETAISRINQNAGHLAEKIRTAASNEGVPCSVTRVGSIVQVHLDRRPPDSAGAVRAIPADWMSALHLALMLEGIYAAPRGMFNVSTALTDDQSASIVAAYAAAFGRIRSLIQIATVAS